MFKHFSPQHVLKRSHVFALKAFNRRSTDGWNVCSENNRENQFSVTTFLTTITELNDLYPVIKRLVEHGMVSAKSSFKNKKATSVEGHEIGVFNDHLPGI